VHYISYHPKYDEWVEKSSDRIQARRETPDLQKGDNVSAWFPKVLLWSEAEIEEIDTANSRMKIAYIGTQDAAYVPLNSTKISITHKKPNDPFNGLSTEEYTLVKAQVMYTEKDKTQANDGTPEADSGDSTKKSDKEEDETHKSMQQESGTGAARQCCLIL